MRWVFGEFTLDTGIGSLVGPEGAVSLRPQTFRLLEVLLSHAPELVDRHTLLDAVWGRSALSPNVLPQAVSELRQALGDPAQKPRFIVTVHRRGYRFIAPVQRHEPAIPAQAGSEQTPSAPPVTSRRRLLPVIGASLVSTAALVMSLWWWQTGERRWLYEDAIPEIRHLLETDVVAAWRLAHEARQRWPGEPVLEQLWRDLSLPVDLISEPPGATVELGHYHDPSAAWVVLGETPLLQQRLPLGMTRLRIRLPGHVTLEVAPHLLPQAEPFRLHAPEQHRDGMRFVPAGEVRYLGQRRQVPAFWIDALEITNRQFRRFVEDGGYRRPELWPEPDRLASLVDRTGMPGPAGWALGTYPEGEDDHPVEGLSWFEAMAYAAWAGKRLPTVFEWYRAAGLGTDQAANFSDVIKASNFGGRGTVAVGSRGGLGPYGTYDMAGNVAEWCLNRAADLRHRLGGSWQENSYQFLDANAVDPLRRRAGSGIRLVQSETPPAPEAVGNVPIPPREVSTPVDDATFALYRSLYGYDPAPLQASLDAVDDRHEAWTRERVSFDAAYPGERVTAQVFIPKNRAPPYQTIVHFPGGDALMLGSSEEAGLLHVEPFLRSGRAVVYPVYRGTFERRLPAAPGPHTQRDLIIDQVRDVRRTLDYLETRDEFDPDRIAFHGLSLGASRAPFVLAIERRFRTAMLVSAGLSPSQHLPAEIQQVDYLPRIDLPLLMIGGREDFTFPYTSSQRPFFELIGTPPAQKTHIALDSGHLPPGYVELTRALLAWSDEWLGPVPPP